MNQVIEKLAKFLRLEAERGYDNRAVFGGLENMLEPWQAEATEAQIPDSVIQVVISRLRDYPNLKPQSRREALGGLWTRLQSEFPELKEFSFGMSEVDPPKALFYFADIARNVG